MLNYLWAGLILLAAMTAVVKAVLFGDAAVFSAMTAALFDSAKTGFEIALGLTGVMALWLGILKIGEAAGLITALARLLSPLFSRLFPGVPRGHPA